MRQIHSTMSEQKNITKPKQKQTNKHTYLQLKNRASNSLEMDLKQICAEGVCGWRAQDI